MIPPSAHTRAPRGRRAVGRVDWLWVLFIVGIFLEYIRPFDNDLRFLQPLRIPGLVTLALTIAFFVGDKARLKEDRLNAAVLSFWLLVSFSILYAANNRWAYNTSTELFWTFTAFVFLIGRLVNSTGRVIRFIYWWIAVQTLLAIHVLTHGGIGTGSFLTDENDVALALNMALPFTFYVAFFPGASRRIKTLLVLAAALMVAAVGVSASRGGVVGLAALVGTMILLSKRPIRNGAVVLMVAGVGLAILIRFLPTAYVQDMQAIQDPNDSTRDERLWSWSIAWEMYKEHPILGVGANNYPWTNADYAQRSPMYNPDRKILGGRTAHSVYFTLLPELGTIGVVIFAVILKMIYNRSMALRRSAPSGGGGADPEAAANSTRFQLIGNAIIASMVAYLVSGAFITVLYYPPFWHLVGICIAVYGAWRSSLGPPGAAAPKRR